MAASLHFLTLNPQTLSHHSGAAAGAAAPSSFAIFTLKPLPKSNLSLSAGNCGVNYATPTFRFLGKVAFSSDLDLDEDDFSGPVEASLSPDLKLYVGNLPFDVDSAALAGLFQQAGNVEEVEVIYDRLSGRSRGFGFVTMSSIKGAEAAVQQFNGYELQGRALRVNSGPPPAKRENSSFREGPRGRTTSDDSNKVYVGNLSWGVDDLTLETLFSEQGKVKEARVVYDRDSGRSKGFGFVTLSSPDEVNNAIESLDGADMRRFMLVQTIVVCLERSLKIWTHVQSVVHQDGRWTKSPPKFLKEFLKRCYGIFP